MKPSQIIVPLLVSLGISPLLLLTHYQLENSGPLNSHYIEVYLLYSIKFITDNLFQMFRVFNAAKSPAIEAVESALLQMLFKVAIQQPLGLALQEFSQTWKSIKLLCAEELLKPEVIGHFDVIRNIGVWSKFVFSICANFYYSSKGYFF